LDVPGPRQPSEPAWNALLSTAMLEDPPALVQLFPWDRRLPTLALALDPASLESEADLPSICSCTLAGYWPGIRCNLRYECGAERRLLYGKVLPPGALAAAAALQAGLTRAVDAAGSLTVPRPYGEGPPPNLLLTQPAEGMPPHGQLR